MGAPRRLRRRARPDPQRDALGQPPLPRAARRRSPRRTSCSPCTPGGGSGSAPTGERLHPHLLRGLPGQLADRRPGAAAQPRLRGRLRARPVAARGPARVPASRGCRRCCGASTRTGRRSGARCPGSRSRPSEYVTPPLPRRDRAGPAAGRSAAGRAAGRDARRERHARLRQRLPARARRGQPRRPARRRSTTPAARPCCAATPPRSTGWPASSPPGPGRAARSAARGAGARGP